MVLDVVLRGRLTGGLAAVHHVAAAVGGQRRHARLGEVEVIRTEVMPFLWRRVSADDATVGLEHLGEEVLEIVLALADHFHVLRRPGDGQGVHVDVSHRLRQREGRVGDVVFGTQQAGFLHGHRGEDHTALRLVLGELAGDLQQRGDARAVVDRAVVDLVTLQRRVVAQVIPVRGIDHRLVRLVRALHHADHVVAERMGDVAVQGDIRLGIQRHGLEAAHVGLLGQFVEVLARLGEQALRGFMRQPARHGQPR